MLPVWRGDFGVDLFFVLSGFLIAGILLDEQAERGRIALGTFYARRLLRLWPALLVVALLELFTDDPNRSHVWANVIYVNNFVPVGLVALGWTWSLAIEEQFYLVGPWVIRGVKPFGTRGRVTAIAAIVAGLIGVAAWVVVTNDLHASDAEIVGGPDMARWGFAFDVFYDKPWMRAGALLSGVVGAVLYREPAVMQALGRGGVRTGIGVFFAVLWMGIATHWPIFLGTSRLVEVAYLSSFRTVFAAGAAFVLLVTLSEHPLGRILTRPLSSRVLYPISQIAYSAYLVNPMVCMFLGKLLKPYVAHGEPPMPIFVPLDVAVTFGCAALLHVFVERPGMELRPRARAEKAAQ